MRYDIYSTDSSEDAKCLEGNLIASSRTDQNVVEVFTEAGASKDLIRRLVDGHVVRFGVVPMFYWLEEAMNG